MSRYPRSLVCVFLLVTSMVFVVGDLEASDPPDMEYNPVTGYVEAVEVGGESGYHVQHVVDEGQGGNGTSKTVSASMAKNPRIAIRSTGESWVVWWQDGPTDEVLFSVRSLPDSWSPEIRVSNVGEDSQHPEIVHSGSSTWIAYQIPAAGNTSIAVSWIIDGPEPFPTRTLLHTTSYGGNVDVVAHSESEEVWITWVESATEVGWSKYDHETDTWSGAEYESYAGTNVKAAREAIQAIVLHQ